MGSFRSYHEARKCKVNTIVPITYINSNGIIVNTDSTRTLGDMDSNHHSFASRFCFYSSLTIRMIVAFIADYAFLALLNLPLGLIL